MENNSLKNLMNLIFTLLFMCGLSFFSYQFCNWYGCGSWTGFLRADLICNACVDTMYHLKNYQVSLYGSVFTLVTYKMTTLINRATSPTQTYIFEDIFEDYDLGKNSPKSLKIK